MKKLSLTVIAAISCITLFVGCGQNRNQNRNPYGPQVGGNCSPYGNSGYDRYGYGSDRYGSAGYGHDRYGSAGYGHDPRSSYYDPTCTGGVQPYPTGRGDCGMYGQGYRRAQHYTHSGSYCTDAYTPYAQGGASFCVGTRGFCPYFRGIEESGEAVLLCNLNEVPGAACPQGLSCQEIGKGDTGICS